MSSPSKVAAVSSGPRTISDREFRELLVPRSRELLQVAAHMIGRPDDEPLCTRPLLGELMHKATELEELLDAYGARNNSLWRPFRATMAAGKLFARVNYVLLHIQHSLPAYRLLEVQGGFATATEEAIAFIGAILRRVARRTLRQAETLGLELPGCNGRQEEWEERLPAGRLAADRQVHKARDASETVTYLATAFLRQAAGSELLHVPLRVRASEYANCVPSVISEESLRRLQHQFHNLQSTYDTFVADTETERCDGDLPVLRGHVSVIFHLLETATELAHYYERHVMGGHPDDHAGQEPLAAGEELLRFLMEYALVFASRFLVAARGLCQEMLRRFAEIDRIDVPAPRYRGFHVRPSTLVAKIVCHYGSEVRMELAGEQFDASTPLDIFRANEKLNRQKRQRITSEVSELPCLREEGFFGDVAQAVRRAIMHLAEKGKVMVYQRPLPIQEPGQDDRDRPPLQYLLDEVRRLQSSGIIDLDVELPVTFIGDRRVLKDLKTLAECGYGEDNFGNNVPLPAEIAYLRAGSVPGG